MSNDLKQLESLSKEERQIALQILQDISQSGSSETYEKLLYADYEEIPVDVETFLKDDKYLGRGLIDKDGRFTVYPYWVDVLKKIFPDPLQPGVYNTVALTGAIGLGKSFEAVLIGLYELYRMLCLRDPYLFYGLQPIDKISFAFINITLDAAEGVAWNKLQQLVQLSPWFMSHGTVNKSDNVRWSPGKKIELICGSQSRHIIGRMLFFAFFDEVSFQPNQDVEKQKQKAKNLVNTASARMQSRFMKHDRNPTILVLASSKRTEQSYMETFIQDKKKKESKSTLIIDEPQWVIRTDKQSDKHFYVAVGNKFLESEVLPLDATELDLQIYRDKGFNILEVPMGYYETFIDDIDIALTDTAGISTTNSMSYISGVRWSKCRVEGLQNPFSKEVIVVGNAPDDKTEYKDYFDITKIPRDILNKPLFIHLDMSLSGDKTGIAGVFIKGKRPTKEGEDDSRELVYQLGFSVSVKAPKGYQVSFEKNRSFIYWLKDQGLKVKGVSYDTFQSADLGQQLAAHNFQCDTISVDRVQDRICQPYLVFKNAIYEQRIITYQTKLLTEEVIGLVRDGNGKIDHSPSGINSKDQCDAVCGSLYNASLHAEEYAFEYGDDLSAVVLSNDDMQVAREQITVDFEGQLRQMFDPVARQVEQQRNNAVEQNQDKNKPTFIDFGMGSSQPYTPGMVESGILAW